MTPCVCDAASEKGRGRVRTDSRLVSPGDTFVAVGGAKADGNDFVAAAIAAGAVRIVSQADPPRDLPSGVEWIKAGDSRAAAAAFACADCGHPSRELGVFAVTGTNGKTTVANLVRHVLDASGIPCGLLSTVENDTHPLARPHPVAAANTTPGPVELQTLFRDAMRNGCKAVAMEVSSHALDQRRIDGTRLRCAAFTNLTQDHLDYHGSMEAYAGAKRKLFFPVPAPGPCAIETPPPKTMVVNADDPFGAELARCRKELFPGAPALTYGFCEGAGIRVEISGMDSDGMDVRFDLGRSPVGAARPVRFHSRLVGRHNAMNLAAAFGAALCFDLDPERVAQALASARPVRGRLEPVAVPGSPAAFFVDYAHTPDALSKVLSTLREIAGGGRLSVVFGAGGDRDRTKRPLMGLACAQGADRLVVTSDNPRSEDPAAIIEDILRGIPSESLGKVAVEPDRAAALRLAVAQADRSGDVVLVAGKGHETYQVLAGKTIHFDDREILMSCN
ncbi:MAG: UDP-N-acetylmuramoyl-L-alanyl-D-glutamate--2,6-diaminopimelate ligase [Kiritimatiellae bacterium]|nr:UDP-N-acetylmuramoyl-L-alanyl-D-glutamate--2,6-diaminopimelate ligase [Kiritimatiellia bacterium]